MTYVIADVHGRGDRYHEILDAVGFSREDTLYILGDVVDRNPDGIELLEEIISSPNIHMLLGNHEYMMVNGIQHPTRRINEWYTELDLWFLNGGEITRNAFFHLSGERQERILTFIKKLPLEIPVTVGGKRFLLVHGSPVSMYTPDNAEYSSLTEFAVWNRFDVYTDRFDEDAALICGHTPTINISYTVPMEVVHMDNVYCIDCGCAYSSLEGGRLACICLETEEIRYSTC